MTRDVHALRSSPFLPAYGNILLVPSFSAGLNTSPEELFPRITQSVPISFGFEPHRLPSMLLGTKRGIPRFRSPCSGEPASQRKVKLTVFSFWRCIVLSLNLKHVRNDVRDKPGLLGKGTHEIPAVWRVHFQPLRAGHMQSPTLVIKSWELVPALPVYHSPRIWLFRRAWSSEWPVVEPAQENTGVGNTCHSVCPRHFNVGCGVQRGGCFIAKRNFLLPMLT